MLCFTLSIYQPRFGPLAKNSYSRHQSLEASSEILATHLWSELQPVTFI